MATLVDGVVTSAPVVEEDTAVVEEEYGGAESVVDAGALVIVVEGTLVVLDEGAVSAFLLLPQPAAEAVIRVPASRAERRTAARAAFRCRDIGRMWSTNIAPPLRGRLRRAGGRYSRAPVSLSSPRRSSVGASRPR
jgi:hypothetical protein